MSLDGRHADIVLLRSTGWRVSGIVIITWTLSTFLAALFCLCHVKRPYPSKVSSDPGRGGAREGNTMASLT